MNYFELYDLPVSFHPDQAAIKSKFYALSRQFHPDRFAITGTGSAELGEALRMSALNNDAFKTLKSADATMAYILKMHSLLEDEEKYPLPPAFLMEMMDLNETLSDYEGNPADDNARRQAADALNEQLSDWQQATDLLTAQFDKGDRDQGLLLKIKDQYFRKKYLLRIQERINRFAAR
jgi:molecular chaperone HscB